MEYMCCNAISVLWDINSLSCWITKQLDSTRVYSTGYCQHATHSVINTIQQHLSSLRQDIHLGLRPCVPVQDGVQKLKSYGIMIDTLWD